MFSDLTKDQYAFLVLTTESGSPYHPFVASLRRMLGLPEIVEDRTRGTKAGQIVPPTDADHKTVLLCHLDPNDQGPIYAKRLPALEALLKGAAPPPPPPPPPAPAADDTKKIDAKADAKK